MRDTKTLIACLSKEAYAIKPLPSLRYWGVRLIAMLTLYGGSIQFFLGFRPDIALQFTRSSFVGEVVLLTAILLTSSISSIIAMVPDVYQKPRLLKLPYAIFLLLTCFILLQLFLPEDARMVMPKPGAHTTECTIFIAAISFIPSAVIFSMLRKGATVRQYQSGSFAVLTASSIGCLTLRLAEATDSISHLLIWHYIPTLLFTILGAAFGKWLLKW